ncbi:YdeI/OmpD-associated family protein [Phytohabitans houttuyneae]|uniref:DUF1905 domain-containing protein n=1 Tax=Phytohabitans houttuyneae TaxID=1076126 RepID=A0A6V8KLI1_9ACTN|nr:YdeI/OmpD-associated family protein [Phytohabitans houttuyneae]GFJ81515.1 hypothetical protein Phou_056950 [Phytohabitans houttuyneae]
MAEKFAGTLVCEGVGAWTYVSVPDDVVSRLGGQSRIPVTGAVNGAAFTGSVMSGPGGSRYVVVNQAVRDAAGVTAGDKVQVTLSKDTAVRTVEVPDDLAAALADHPRALEYFDGLSYSRKKVYVAWITEAKRAETREARISKAIDMLTEGRPLKG